jgi:hypothetical protein
MTDILWHEDRWVFLDHTNPSTRWGERNSVGTNLILLFETFLGFGMTTKEIQQELNGIKTELGWNDMWCTK